MGIVLLIFFIVLAIALWALSFAQSPLSSLLVVLAEGEHQNVADGATAIILPSWVVQEAPAVPTVVAIMAAALTVEVVIVVGVPTVEVAMAVVDFSRSSHFPVFDFS